ncbi:MAG: hypothetical protein LBR36_02885 [Bacteroidales bacterium]|jgi:hypothetical protein|nr:hypothetical protein [Bacteroidales bacterium]
MKTVDKVIFLDIDGVLQPFSSRERFEHVNNMQPTYDELWNKFGVDYSVYDKYDVAAVVYDWDKEAVAELKRILETTGASIVISSDWRQRKTIDILTNFFRIYGLADYIYDYTPDLDYGTIKKFKQTEEYSKYHEWRSIEIAEYLKAHPQITKWVAIDDLNLAEDFPNNAVVIYSILKKKYGDECIKLLT